MMPSLASAASLKFLNLNPFNKPNKAKKSNKLDGILAFRTITTMLALIQPPTETPKIVRVSTSKHKELRILDALAILLVREYETATVTLEPYDRESIRVISVVNDSGSALTDAPIFADTSMQLVDPDTRVPEVLSKYLADPENLLNTFLQTQWGTESFDTHAWMLKMLLRQSKNHLETLQLYVVAADFSKMLARMIHPVSKHYLACFQRVKSRTFEPIEGAPTKSDGGSDLLFLDEIPILAEFMKIPNLEKMAQAANKKESFKVYNKDTCIEFHEVLCELLERFHQSLKDLKDLKKSTVKTRKGAAQIGQSDLEQILQQLNQVLAFGRAVRAIVRGNAIKEHLTTITPFLEANGAKFWPMPDELDDNTGTEFHVLKPYSTDDNGEPLLLWKSYHDWLRLMINHFDAIHVLDNHLMTLGSSFIDISFKVLYPPLPDQKMLPWKQLLENEKYFPPIQHTADQPSTAELIDFLTSPTRVEDGTILKGLIAEVNAAQTKQKLEITDGVVYKDLTNDIEILTDEVDELRDCSSAGWKDSVVAILRQVEALRCDHTLHGRLSRLESIANMLETLKESFSLTLHERLQPGTPLSLGAGFSGTGHGEAYAACLNSLSGIPGRHDSLSEDLLEEFKKTRHILGLSTPCCPTCAHLLSLLKPNGKDRFLTTGDHPTISPCTLPECLSEQIIDQMVVEFGLRLRKELINLQRITKVQRAWARRNERYPKDNHGKPCTD